MELIFSLIIALAVEAIKRVSWKERPWWAVHLLVLAIAGIFSLAKFGLGALPEVYYLAIKEIWIGAVILYEVLIKRVLKALESPPA